ncbi:MAG: sulfotransferase domain-containing protein [Paracoccaceae bacterium]
MTLEAPIRSRDYLGPCTDTRIWDRFKLRPGDVVLSTPPKSGTTWSQAILMMLIHQQAISDRAIWKDSKWLDCNFRDQNELASALEAQDHRRCIKSHTPFDGITYTPDAIYIAVYRHPVDVYFSLERHVANMNSDFLDFHFAESPAENFSRYLDNSVTDMGTDDLTLASLCHHYQSFRNWAHLPNIHFFHYSDMKRDRRREVLRFAAIMGLDPSDALIDAIVEASSFGQMKDVVRMANRPTESVFANPAGFFDAGTNQKWLGRLSQEQLLAYRERLSDMIGRKDQRWLEDGSTKD